MEEKQGEKGTGKMENAKIILTAENMTKSFGITRALKGVPLQLKSGEVLGLIGENGSGKSTLTSIIAGIQPADAGEIRLNGAPYGAQSSVEACRQGICMILQEKATFDHLSVAQNFLHAFGQKEGVLSAGDADCNIIPGPDQVVLVESLDKGAPYGFSVLFDDAPLDLCASILIH